MEGFNENANNDTTYSYIRAMLTPNHPSVKRYPYLIRVLIDVTFQN